jgi:hypothetical protein
VEVAVQDVRTGRLRRGAQQRGYGCRILQRRRRDAVQVGQQVDPAGLLGAAHLCPPPPE